MCLVYSTQSRQHVITLPAVDAQGIPTNKSPSCPVCKEEETIQTVNADVLHCMECDSFFYYRKVEIE